jgi:hypothetical protein
LTKLEYGVKPLNMPIKTGDLVHLKKNRISTYVPATGAIKGLRIPKGVVFEVVVIFTEIDSAYLHPLNEPTLENRVVIVLLTDLVLCSKAVKLLYGKTSKRNRK